MTKDNALTLARTVCPQAVLAEPQAEGDLMHGYRIFNGAVEWWLVVGEGKC